MRPRHQWGRKKSYSPVPATPQYPTYYAANGMTQPGQIPPGDIQPTAQLPTNYNCVAGPAYSYTLPAATDHAPSRSDPEAAEPAAPNEAALMRRIPGLVDKLAAPPAPPASTAWPPTTETYAYPQTSSQISGLERQVSADGTFPSANRLGYPRHRNI